MDEPIDRAFDEIDRALESAQAEEPAEPAPPYSTGRRGLSWHKPTKDGEVIVPLTNFAARIVGQVTRDDGAEQLRVFELEAELRGRRYQFHIDASEFASLAWVPRELGGEAVVFPGQMIKDHARVAIQTLSGEIRGRAVYAHTGWRKVDGQMVYLHAGGAIGTTGPVAGVDCDLAGAGLGDAVLVAPCDPIVAVRAALNLLDLDPAGPRPRRRGLLARAAGRCGLHRLRGRPDRRVQVAGRSAGAGALGRRIDAGHLPGAWSSTANALEGLAFAAKDMLLVVDDLAPGGTKEDGRAATASPRAYCEPRATTPAGDGCGPTARCGRPSHRGA